MSVWARIKCSVKRAKEIGGSVELKKGEAVRKPMGGWARRL